MKILGLFCFVGDWRGISEKHTVFTSIYLCRSSLRHWSAGDDGSAGGTEALERDELARTPLAGPAGGVLALRGAPNILREMKQRLFAAWLLP